MSAEPFGTTPAGEAVARHTLERDGVRLRVLTYGAIVQALELPGADGAAADVVLGFATLEEYVAHNSPGPYFGAVVGRVANRIAGGRFTLDGREHVLARNDGPNHLHGGPAGFHRRVWDVAAREPAAITLRRTSPDGEEGYPGALTVELTYALLAGGDVELAYAAESDAPTIVNLTNHSSFNLAGGGSADAHELEVRATHYLPTDATAIPAGAPAPVAGSPLDFRRPVALGAAARAGGPQLAVGRGVDHAFVLDRPDGAELALAARLRDPVSGRTLEVHTTEPGLQVYTGNFLDGSLTGKDGRRLRQGDGVALETQHHPDAPNRPDFPTTTLRPGERFRSRTQWHFPL